MSVDAILQAIRSLTPAERAELDSRLDAEPAEPEISRELAKLLDERNAAADANPDAGYTMEEVVAYVKRKK